MHDVVLTDQVFRHRLKSTPLPQTHILWQALWRPRLRQVDIDAIQLCVAGYLAGEIDQPYPVRGFSFSDCFCEGTVG